MLLQREYDVEEVKRLHELIESSIVHLPYTFASPLSKIKLSLESNEYGRAMNYALDFFEISILWLSAYLLRRLIDNSSKLSAASIGKFEEIVRFIDVKRPMSFGDSLNSIFIPLLAIANNEVPDALTESVSNSLFKKKKCVLLGDKKNPNIVHIRNEYRGHSTTLSENIYRGVIYTVEPYLIKVLEGLEPLHGADVYSWINDVKVHHKGVDAIKEDVTVGTALPEGHYVVENGTDAIDLFPLIVCKNENEIYVFHTLKGESVSYISANENVLNLTTADYNDDFDRLLQNIVPGFDIAKQLNYNELKDLSHAESRRFLYRIYKEKRYNKELFVDRRELSALLDRFIADSHSTLLPLLGEPGQGKTNQLAYWVESMIEADSNVLIFQCSDFITCQLETKLRDTFGLKTRNIEKILNDIHAELERNDKAMYIFFDAVNECVTYQGDTDIDGPLALFRAIGQLLLLPTYHRFKVIITCRSYTWKNLLKGESNKYADMIFIEGGKKSSAQLNGFTSDELNQAYSLYRDLYQMVTDFADLSPSARVRLKDPLVLKLASTNYQGQELPPNIECFTSISIFEKLLNDISRSYAGKRQIEILDLIGEYFLSQYESNNPIDSISESNIESGLVENDILKKIGQRIFNRDGISIAYGELINKPERPVLRVVESAQNGERLIQFIYERFLEFMMARIFMRRCAANVEPGYCLPASVYLEHIETARRSEVYLSTLRNVLAMDILRTHSYSSLIELIECHGDNPTVMELVNALSDVMIRENYEKDLFAFITEIQSKESSDETKTIEEFNKVLSLIENNKASSEIIKKYHELSESLGTLIRLRKIALADIVNGIFSTDYFNENLYSADPYVFLWRLLEDPMREIKNDACMYIYYLANRRTTLGGTRLDESITKKIIKHMIMRIKEHSIVPTMASSRKRKVFLELTETAVRLSMILIIDRTLSRDNPESRDKELNELLGYIQEIFAHVTFKGRLVKMVMPLFKIVLRKQITFQSDYVNNAVEYQGFWLDDVVPSVSDTKGWDHKTMEQILPFINYTTCDSQQRAQLRTKTDVLQRAILEAYKTGDSFSYFVLERVLIIFGIKEWPAVKSVVERILSKEYSDNEWFDYSQMSILYSLYQIALFVEDDAIKKEVLEIYTSNARDWTLRCRGYFKARNSHKANPRGTYKRNVMSWYTAVYNSVGGIDGKANAGDNEGVPLFYQLINQAIETGDRELFVHLLENISESITDGGYIHMSLGVLKYIMTVLDSEEKLNGFEQGHLSVADKIGHILTAAKNYFPVEVDDFIKQDLDGLSFPGVAKYRNEIVGFNPNVETLADLMTHKFGNYLIWSLINEKVFSNFAIRVVQAAVHESDSFSWYDHAMKLVFKEVFNVNYKNV